MMAFAGVVILLTAVPFGHAVLGIGVAVGISPFLMLQWIVPVATETPELVVAFVLLTHGRGGQSIAILLAGAVSQYTFALGTLPIAYAAGVASGRSRSRAVSGSSCFLTVGVALYAVGALIGLRLSRARLLDHARAVRRPAARSRRVLTRLLFAVAFWVIAIDVLAFERRRLPGLLKVLWPARSAVCRSRP